MTAAAPLLKVNAITHVSLVVKDIFQTMDDYWKIFGIGPWDVYDWEYPQLRDRVYHGRPGWGHEKIAHTRVGPVGLELAQPVSGDSIYQDFLNEHGEGIHHLSFEVPDMAEATRKLSPFPILQSANGGADMQHAWSYIYLDMKPLGCIWEPVWVSGALIGRGIKYPGPEAMKTPPLIDVKVMTHVSLVVKDIFQTMDDYWKIFGIGPWDVYDWEYPHLRDRVYHGRPGWGHEKIAHTRVGPVGLELAQPVSGDSIYQDFLNEHGEGIHHLSFEVPDMAEATRKLSPFPILQSANGGADMQHAWSYIYLDMKPLGCIWEPVWVSGALIGRGIKYPDIKA